MLHSECDSRSLKFSDAILHPRGSAQVLLAVLEFGEFKLDCARFELLHNGHSVKLERKPLELLILLATSNDRLVTRAEIAERLWDREVFVDTEHGINTAIRKIRQVLRDDPDQPRFVQTAPGMGYRFIAPVVTLPSPGGDATPQEAKLSDAIAVPRGNDAEEVVTAPATELPASRKFWLATGIVGALGVLILAVTLGPHPLAARWLQRDSLPAITSLAVIPLDNLSGDPNQEYFTDGMTDELITMLAKDSNLRITSRTSVMQYKNARRPLPEIARALNVDGILEGSISRSNGEVHMTLQLIRADTDTHVWADSYDRNANDVAALPDEAARDIANRLHSAAASPTVARYVNPEAHDDYLHGHYLWMVGRNSDAGTYYQKAVQIQPDYALGWAGLSEFYSVRALDGDLDPRQALPLAEDAGRKAVELDPALPQAHTVLGAAIFFNRLDGTQALIEVTRATELNPQYSEAYHLHAKILCALGRNNEAIVVQKLSTAANPFAHPGAMAEIYLCVRDYDDSIADGRMRLKDFPDSADILDDLAESYHWKHLDKEATEMRARELIIEGKGPLGSAVRAAFKSGGFTAVVRSELADLEKKALTGRVATFDLARLHALLSEHEKTLDLLEQSAHERDPLLLFMIQPDPAFDFLHADPRYRALIQRIGLPPAY